MCTEIKVILKMQTGQFKAKKSWHKVTPALVVSKFELCPFNKTYSFPYLDFLISVRKIPTWSHDHRLEALYLFKVRSNIVFLYFFVGVEGRLLDMNISVPDPCLYISF